MTHHEERAAPAGRPPQKMVRLAAEPSKHSRTTAHPQRQSLIDSAREASEERDLSGVPGREVEDACEDEGAEHDGREPEEDDDTSDYEASLCGVSFGVGSCSALDAEGTSAAFALDQSQGA